MKPRGSPCQHIESHKKIVDDQSKAKGRNGQIIAFQTKGGKADDPGGHQGAKDSRYQRDQRKGNPILRSQNSGGIGTYCKKCIMAQRDLATITHQDIKSYEHYGPDSCKDEHA